MSIAKPLNNETIKKKVAEVIATSTSVFGLPGTALVVECEACYVPNDYIELASKLATPPSSFHVLDEAGDWVLKEDVDIRKVRQELYLLKWPQNRQLEAYQDALNGDDTKLQQMNEDFNDIRKRYPIE